MAMKTTIKRGDIVKVRLDGAEGSEMKNDEKLRARPCIVVQNDEGNAVSTVTIVVPLTGAAHDVGITSNVAVTAAELGPGGRDSTVECGQMRTIDGDARILRKLGSIAPDALKRIDQGLLAAFGIAGGA